ncbi:MAG: restriction endonuclease subunit S [Bacillota bacterium]
MSRLEELIAELCPDGVECKRLGEIATDMYRGAGIRRDQLTAIGTPCVRYGEIYTTYNLWFDSCVSYTDENEIGSKRYCEHGDVLFAITGENVEEIAKSCVYVGHEKCLAGGDIVVMKHSEDPKYMAYALSTVDAQRQKSAGKVKSKVVHSSIPALRAIRIPLPPLPVQQEIVRILDRFTALEAELKAELEARKKQYEYYRDHLLAFRSNVKRMALGDIGRVLMCRRIYREQTQPVGDVPFYKIGTFGKEADAFISQDLFEEYRTKYPYPKKGDVLLSAAGTIGRAVIFDGMPAYFQDSNIVWIDNDERIVLNKYLYYFYPVAEWAVARGGTVARLYNRNIQRTVIPVPPLAE